MRGPAAALGHVPEEQVPEGERGAAAPPQIRPGFATCGLWGANSPPAACSVCGVPARLGEMQEKHCSRWPGASLGIRRTPAGRGWGQRQSGPRQQHRHVGHRRPGHLLYFLAFFFSTSLSSPAAKPPYVLLRLKVFTVTVTLSEGSDCHPFASSLGAAVPSAFPAVGTKAISAF